MRRYLLWGACSGVLLWMTAMPAFAQATFHYTDGFETAWDEYWDANGQYNNGWGWVPAGWRPYSDAFAGDTYWNNRDKPRLYTGDGWGWCPSPFGISGTGCEDAGQANQLYAGSWSGQYRFNMNERWDTYQGGTRTGIWFVGDTPAPDGTPYYPGNYPRHWDTASPGTETYPMDLTANSLKAKFDLSIRTGDGGPGLYTDGSGTYIANSAIAFAVQPATDLGSYPSSGYLPYGEWYCGVGGIPGFAIEFDIRPDAGDPSFNSAVGMNDQPFDAHNHVGLDVGLYVGDLSVKTNLDAPFAASIVDMKKVGDNNMPVRVTVVYNDPALGGSGVVRVYMYVDPATVPAQPYVCPTATPLYDPASLAFGMEDSGGTLVPKNGGLGELVLEACYGVFPTDSAIFGFVSRRENGDAVLMVDNVDVETNTASGTACDPGTQVVTIAKDLSDLAEPATDGQFTLSRTGDTTNDLTVKLTVAGTASNGVDYAALPGYVTTDPTVAYVTIPAGLSSVAVPLEVIDDAKLELTETIILTVVPQTNVVLYVVGTASSATWTIADDETGYYGTPSFVYSEDFDNWPNMPTNSVGGVMALGWLPWSNDVYNGTPIDGQPRILAQDWGGANWGNGGAADDPWHSRWGAQGVLDYTVPWSGTPADLYHTGRYNLIHPGRDCNYQNCDTWYTGASNIPAGWTARHEGTYPIDLTTDSMRAEFDVSLRTGGGMTVDSGLSSGITFAVQPVNTVGDVVQGGRDGAFLGWGPAIGLPGFAVEFDVRQNGGDVDANHMGIDVAMLWSDASVASLVVSSAIPNMAAVCDNNQPLHVTVYYNDPTHGGPGVVQVYLKVKAADKAVGDPAFPDGQTPYSFGESETDPAGALVLEACVGSWPTGTKAVFGFTSSIEHYPMTTISQVDNVHVEAAATTGTACVPTFFDPGTEVVLTAEPTAPAPDPSDTLGWYVRSYPNVPNYGYMAGLKQSIYTYEQAGVLAAELFGEPDLNYIKPGSSELTFGASRLVPGFATAVDWYGVLATGYIYFPSAGSYSLCVNSDNGAELIIGTGTTNQVVIDSGDDGVFGAGFNAGSYINLVVDTPGVYPIQLIWEELWGGAGLEVYRRVGDAVLLNQMVLVGSTNGGLADQPIIYGTLNGQPPPDLVSTYGPAADETTITIASSEKIAGTTDGVPGWNAKAAIVPNRYWAADAVGPNVYGGVDMVGETIALHWLDLLTGTPTVVSSINFETDGLAGYIPGTLFPGLPASAGQMVFRADGYAVLPAGIYWLGLRGDDDSYLQIGNQKLGYVWVTNRMFRINVPVSGVYPIRYQCIGSGAPNDCELWQLTATGLKAVGEPGTIQIYTSATTPYVFAPESESIITADRKVAAVGDGLTEGWNVKLATGGPDHWMQAIGTAAVEDNLYINNPAGGGGPVATASVTNMVPDLNYWDAMDPGDYPNYYGFPPRFETGKRLWQDDFGSILDPWANDNFAVRADGYIEFPAAGTYAFNINVEDAGIMWIGGKMVNQIQWAAEWAVDANPAVIHVDQPGIYDIRVDYTERGYNAMLCMWQFLPDGNAVLVNSPSSTVKVYSALNPAATPPAPYTSAYHNPTVLGQKAGNAGQGSGFHVQVAQATLSDSDPGWDQALGHGTWYTVDNGRELLASVFDGVPSLNYTGTAMFDGTVSRIAFYDDSWDPYPGGVWGNDFFAIRCTGYLAMKKGGHLFVLYSDDGAILTIGGQMYRTGDSKGMRWQDQCYFYAPEDGLYPFNIEYVDLWSGNGLLFMEMMTTNSNPDTFVYGTDFQVVNDPGAITQAYLYPCNTPFADTDDDGDVDQDDFGAFQACYSGSPIPDSLGAGCNCFDRNLDGTVDSIDYSDFMNCWSGPGILAPDCE